MQQFELDYADLVREVLLDGILKQTRNGNTISVFGRSLVIDDIDEVFPIIQGRKMWPQGVLGELAAMLRGPKHIDDFKKWGCNYWGDWAKEDGSINIDYGNVWRDFNGVDQIAQLKDNLANNPNDRRMIISGWKPDGMSDLDLPCCHYSYQFYVADNVLSMIWTQRSVDMMIGLPSDIIFAAAWLIAIANEFGMSVGSIKMDFGDCHVYEEHMSNAWEYVHIVNDSIMEPIGYNYPNIGKDFCEFVPADIELDAYVSFPPLTFELKS